MKAYEVCPICDKKLRHSTLINRRCAVLDKKNFSFIESTCNHSDFSDIGNQLPTHMYFQVVSLYGDLLYEKVHFPSKNYEIEINYVSHTTTLIYYTTYDPVLPPVPPKKVVLKNRLVELDFPDLTKAINKIKTLALFL